jgi:hypothetical protein
VGPYWRSSGTNFPKCVGPVSVLYVLDPGMGVSVSFDIEWTKSGLPSRYRGRPCLVPYLALSAPLARGPSPDGRTTSPSVPWPCSTNVRKSTELSPGAFATAKNNSGKSQVEHASPNAHSLTTDLMAF